MAYYSNSGAQIHSGAAGYGPKMAFRDGSLGRRSVRGFGAGMGQSHNWGPSPRAFQDGSLGASNPGPLMSFKDGSLGMPLFLETQDGIEQLETPVTIHHGPMGEYFSPSATGEYFSGTAGCAGGCGQFHLREYQAPPRRVSTSLSKMRKLNRGFARPRFGMGQVEPTAYPTPTAEAVNLVVAAAISTEPSGGPAPTIDLSNPATVKEIKTAMVISPWVRTFALHNAEVMADVEDPVWTKMTVQIVGAWVSGYVEFLYSQPTPPATPKATFLDALLAEGFVGEFFVPNALGLRSIYFGATAGSIQVGHSPAEAFPILTAFLTEETVSGSEGGVLPPAIEGQVPAKGGNMLAIGIGVAALAVVGFAVMGKKRG